MTAAPDRHRLRAVQGVIDDAVDRVERDPATVLHQLTEVIEETRHWTRSDAHGWCLLLTARALRFLDALADAVTVAEAALGQASGDLAAHLHLEAGLALNQADQPRAAEAHLRTAIDGFAADADPFGVSWACTALAESLCATGRTTEAASTVARALDATDEPRCRVRALKQQAVVKRQLGDLATALALIQEVVALSPTRHFRANALLELGHIHSHYQDYRGADAAFADAAVEYLACSDSLGQANTHRAMATNDLLLGRIEAGLRHLHRAEELYGEAGHRSGRGYVLCQRSTVLASRGELAAAEAAATTAIDLFSDNADPFGLCTAHRTRARIRAVQHDLPETQRELTRALEYARASASPLAVAGVLLAQAELVVEPDHRIAAARQAAEHYRALHLPLGAAYALARCAAAMSDAQHDEALTLAAEASRELFSARSNVSSPDARADQSFSSRDVTTSILHVCHVVNTEAAHRLAAATLLDDVPLGLRAIRAHGDIPEPAQAILGRIERIRARSGGIDPASERPLLQQLSVALTTLAPEHAPPRPDLEDLRRTHPASAILIIGSPTSQARLPIAWALPHGPAGVTAPEITAEHAAMIDALGSVSATEATHVALWYPDQLHWQHALSALLLPSEVSTWLRHPPSVPHLVVVMAPVLAHLPLEALLIDDVPLGVRAAVVRVPIPAVTCAAPQLDSVIAYLDPAVTWDLERAALRPHRPTTDPAHMRQQLGSDRLIVIGCHGHAASGLSGTLTAADGTPVLTAADMLSTSLCGSVVLLEACWAGRYVGARMGEHLTLATAALLAGAHRVTAGLFALPADQTCTGRISSAFIGELRHGHHAAEALRRARSQYWSDPPPAVEVPGTTQTMSARAPWAWAGLVTYG